jgi:hypothetical protein
MTDIPLFSNNASSTIAAGINSTATTVTLTTGTGYLFPSPTSGQYFSLTHINPSTSLAGEIVYCTNRTGDVLTIVRGQEGTTATDWVTLDVVANLITAGDLSAITSSNTGATPAQVQQNYYNFGTATWTADAYVLTLPSPGTLSNGMLVSFIAPDANTTTAPTLQINSDAAKTITSPDGLPINIGQITQNAATTFIYNSAQNRFELQTVANAEYLATEPLVQHDVLNYAGESLGSGDYFLIIMNKFYSPLNAGFRLSFTVQSANTSANPVINLYQYPSTFINNSPIIRPGGANVDIGEILPGQIHTVIYNGSSWEWQNAAVTQNQAQLNTYGFWFDSGTSTNYKLTSRSQWYGLQNGMEVSFLAANANSTATPTVQLANGSGWSAALPINAPANSYNTVYPNIPIGMVQGYVTLIYSETATAWVIKTPAWQDPQITSFQVSKSSTNLEINIASPLVKSFRSTTLSDGQIVSDLFWCYFGGNTTIPQLAPIANVGAFGLLDGSVNYGTQRLYLILGRKNGGVLGMVNANCGQNLDETNLITMIGTLGRNPSVIYTIRDDGPYNEINIPYRVIGYIDLTIPSGWSGSWADVTIVQAQGAGGNALFYMPSIGYDQVYVDVTSSIVTGTIYYNTTNKPITIIVEPNGGSSGGCYLYVNGVQIAKSDITGISGFSFFVPITAIIPPNASYEITVDSGVTLFSCFILR